ncbi:MAG: hypothetical protein WC792_06315 [Candidatus Micrarchaeia archaeon]|jgi:hypothetical protein
MEQIGVERHEKIKAIFGKVHGNGGLGAAISGALAQNALSGREAEILRREYGLPKGKGEFAQNPHYGFGAPQRKIWLSRAKLKLAWHTVTGNAFTAEPPKSLPKKYAELPAESKALAYLGLLQHPKIAGLAPAQRLALRQVLKQTAGRTIASFERKPEKSLRHSLELAEPFKGVEKTEIIETIAADALEVLANHAAFKKGR